MPYIKSSKRQAIDGILSQLELDTAGDYNYVITKLLHNKLDTEGLCYDNINEIVGILECAKQEFYRKVAGDYEDIKQRENGSISSFDLY